MLHGLQTRSNPDAFLVFSTDQHRNLFSLNLFVADPAIFQSEVQKISVEGGTAVKTGLAGLLAANVLLDDHEEVHKEAGRLLNLHPDSTKHPKMHWHWGCTAPSRANTDTLLIMLNAFGIIQKEKLLPLFKAIRQLP
jgi:hypothetical protein